MTSKPDPTLRHLLDAATPPLRGESGSWEDVLCRALLLSEESAQRHAETRRQPPLSPPGSRHRRRGETVPSMGRRAGGVRPEEQGWGTRPIRPAGSGRAAVLDGLGWGTRPM